VIADDDELIVIGSQAILGSYPEAPSALLVSVEADLYPKNHPERADLIDGTIGELSPFHDTYGYYAQGVGPTTATLPTGWQDRLVSIRGENTRWATGLCIDPNDLVLAKYAAGRDKDRRFNRDAARHRLVDLTILLQRLPTMPLSDAQRAPIGAQLRADFA
jgi:hypothetical protein